ncbi:MAG: STN domain-containing protein, partial [Rubripirellula sp.]
WINVDEEVERDLSAKLERKGVFEFVETPLSDCLRSVADQFELKIIVRTHALDEIGLSGNEPISLALSDVTLGDALNELLSNLDLTYTLSGGLVVVTTMEAAEQRLLNRIYWLDGTGLMHDQASEIIQATVSPDTWASLGGPSTMSVFINPRAGLVISTTYRCHKEIERIMSTVREAQFSSDPDLDAVETFVPSSPMGTGTIGF